MKKGLSTEIILTIGILIAVGIALLQLRGVFYMQQKSSEKSLVSDFIYDIESIIQKALSTTGNAAFTYKPNLKKYVLEADGNKLTVHDKISGENISLFIDGVEFMPGRVEDNESICIMKKIPIVTTTSITLPPSIQSDPRFCVHTDIDFTGEDFAISQTKNLGVTWIKQLFQWGIVQPNNQNEWNWETFDRWYSKADTEGIKIIPRLHGAPGWAKTEGINSEWGNRPDLDKFDEFGNFVREFVSRYQPEYIEIWNEPNLMNEWTQNGVNPEEYVDLLKVASTAARSVKPDIKIIFGGLASTYTDNNDPHHSMDEFTFLRQSYSYEPNLGSYYDILGHHPYGYHQSPLDRCPDGSNENCWGFDRARLLHDFMVNELGDDKPIMFTEFGWWFDWVNEETQGEYLYQSYQYAMSNWPWVEKMCWWILTYNPQWDNTGAMFDSNRNPRPAYYCYQSLTQASCNHPYIGNCPC